MYVNTNPIRFAIEFGVSANRERACFIYGYIILYLINKKKPEIYIIYIYIYRTEKQSVKKNKIYSVIFMILYLLVETETDKR